MEPGRDRNRNPGSVVRHVSAVRNITDCATRPGLCEYSISLILVPFSETSSRNESITILTDKRNATPFKYYFFEKVKNNAVFNVSPNVPHINNANTGG